MPGPARRRATRPDRDGRDDAGHGRARSEATRRIRALPAFAGIPIIAASASASGEDEAKSYAAGANAFLPKPIAHELLLKTIGEQLSLTWTHEPAAPPTSAATEGMDDFVVPPPDQIEQLHQLARLGDMRRIRAHADHLAGLDPRYAPFAGELRILAENYRSKAITALVERCRAGQEAAGGRNRPA